MDMKETGDPREYEAFIREIDDSRYAIDKDMVPRGVIPKRRGMSLSRSLAMEGVFPFTNFAPRLLASLVASSTAACTSGVVTVTATHGIPATAFDGYSIYYPGSNSLAAGWYADFSRTGADTCTFSAPLAADFTSESINSGAAMVDEITIASLTLPGNTLSPGSMVRVDMGCNGDAVASNKTVKAKLNATTLAQSLINTATSSFCGALTFCNIANRRQFGVGSRESNANSSEYYGTENTGVSSTVSVTGQLAAAGMYMGFVGLKVRID